MTARLNAFVHVLERDSDGRLTGREGVFGPGEEVPSWVQASITNPGVWAVAPAGPPGDVDPAATGSHPQPAGVDPEAVPAGSADEVAAWVGADPARASLAREAEEARPKPRSGLLDRLDRVLAGAQQ